MGIVLTLLCLAFFAQSLFALNHKLLADLPLDALLVGLAVSIFVYTVLLVGVTTGFAHLVQATGHMTAAAGEGLIVWGQANIAKYLPGNVLHFAGRQVLGARYGWPQAGIATASLLEVGLFVLLPAALAALALTATGADLGPLGRSGQLGLVVLAAALGLACVLFAARLARWLPPPVGRLVARLELPRPAAILPALLYFLLFFVGMSLIAWWLYGVVTGRAAPADLPLLAGAFLVSWLLGFIVPGAPGGIGVREGTFALFGGVLLGQEGLVVVALLLRLVTLMGEGLLFLLALHLARRSTPAASVSVGRTSPWRGQLVSAAVVSPERTGRPRTR
jgi:hypothetical protein